MADGVWKGVQPQVIGHFKQLLLNKFFDPSTPSTRKVDDGEKRKRKKEKKKKKIMAEIVATNVVASRPPNGDRLQRRPLVPKGERMLRAIQPLWYAGQSAGMFPNVSAAKFYIC